MSAPANVKVVLVTGASSGIGQAIARHLAARGWRVFGTSRRETTGFDGVDMLPMEVDEDDSVTRAVSAIAEKTGRLDAVVNNAGWALMGPVDTPIAEARAQMETNFFGVLRVCRAALPVMREQRSGHIVNISSLGGIFGIPFSGIYSAEYEREIMGKLAEMGAGRVPRASGAEIGQPEKRRRRSKSGGKNPCARLCTGSAEWT
jgi:NAD(P)-dependent dehydrogenase (short-subunit alcohol dehydrogenase family)